MQPPASLEITFQNKEVIAARFTADVNLFAIDSPTKIVRQPVELTNQPMKQTMTIDVWVQSRNFVSIQVKEESKLIEFGFERHPKNIGQFIPEENVPRDRNNKDRFTKTQWAVEIKAPPFLDEVKSAILAKLTEAQRPLDPDYFYDVVLWAVDAYNVWAHPDVLLESAVAPSQVQIPENAGVDDDWQNHFRILVWEALSQMIIQSDPKLQQAVQRHITLPDIDRAMSTAGRLSL